MSNIITVSYKENDFIWLLKFYVAVKNSSLQPNDIKW